MTKSTLAIIAGGDGLPVQLMQQCRREGRAFFILGFDGITDMSLFSDVPDSQKASVRLGAAGEALAHIRKSGAKEAVLAGKFKRPSLTALRPDATAAMLLPRVAKALLSGGDNALLSTVLPILEEHGITIVGCHDVLPELLAPEGQLGAGMPDANDKAQIERGIAAARDLGRRDRGQSVVVLPDRILEEGSDGTDALLRRAAQFKTGGVLVKMEKPGQDRRVDLPAIGANTVELAHAAGLKGIAFQAGSTVIVGNKNELIDAANRYGMFLVGVRA